MHRNADDQLRSQQYASFPVARSQSVQSVLVDCVPLGKLVEPDVVLIEIQDPAVAGEAKVAIAQVNEALKLKSVAKSRDAVLLKG